LHISTVPLPDYGLRKFERNRFVRIREKFGRISENTRLSHCFNNGVMLTFPPGSSVTVRVRPHNVLGGSNRKSGSLSPKNGLPPYFYFRFGRQRLQDDGFRRISARVPLPVVQAPKSVRVIQLPVR